MLIPWRKLQASLKGKGSIKDMVVVQHIRQVALAKAIEAIEDKQGGS